MWGEPSDVCAGDDPIAAKILRILRSEADHFACVRLNSQVLADLADCGPAAVDKALRRLMASGRIEDAGYVLTRRVRLCPEWRNGH